MKKCLIYQPSGLGDIIWVQPIIDKYIMLENKIYIYIKMIFLFSCKKEKQQNATKKRKKQKIKIVLTKF
jgi:hypothetical protein